MKSRWLKAEAASLGGRRASSARAEQVIRLSSLIFLRVIKGEHYYVSRALRFKLSREAASGV